LAGFYRGFLLATFSFFGTQPIEMRNGQSTGFQRYLERIWASIPEVGFETSSNLFALMAIWVHCKTWRILDTLRSDVSRLGHHPRSFNIRHPLWVMYYKVGWPEKHKGWGDSLTCSDPFDPLVAGLAQLA
jgi:hypothetical protein